jgi:hypothetical protein
VSERQPEPAAGGYSENAYTWFLDEEAGELVFGERLDPRQNLATLDEEIPAPVEPELGWGDGVHIVDGRPVRRLSPPSQRESARRRAGNASPSMSARLTATRRRGQSRERRGRPATRRSRAPSRDGPSDDAEGDGEGPPSPAPQNPISERHGRAPSNSPYTDGVCRRWSVGDHGIDTIVLGWRDADAAVALRAIALTPPRDSATGREQRHVWHGPQLRLALPVAGITLGVYPGRQLVTAEGRMAAMVAGHAHDHSLAAPHHLLEAVERVRDALASIGVSLTTGPVVCRIDLAAELLFEEAANGLAYMRACQQGLLLPRLAQRCYHARGENRLETIAWQTPKGNKTHVRLYDAGAKHGTHPPGLRIRLERERRWDGRSALTPEQLLASGLAGIFREPMGPWLRGTHEIVVATPPEAVRRLFDRVRRGELPRRTAEALSAKINMLAYGSDLLSPLDRRRRERDLRAHGISIDVSGDPGRMVVDLSTPIAALAERWERQP